MLRAVRLFIGSSSEGKDVARSLQAELGETVEAEVWYQNVFKPGGYVLEDLIAKAHSLDFAVLIASPDDTTSSRGTTMQSARDNVILEFGLFAGVLGRERVYLLQTGDLKLPTDMLGQTRLSYKERSDGNLRAAVSVAAMEIEERITKLKHRHARGESFPTDPAGVVLKRELELVCANAAAQGWVVKANTDSTLRLRSPKGQSFTLPKSRPSTTREDLRKFAAKLKAAGLRVNGCVLRPPSESPF